ncbi:unnamed protein product [Linum trigynum]|uniref:Uncharacterized protein n=1 Tax=Linum trigynum TaxID=586398 RepID=A0AAV2FEL6_9ROSI
MSKSRLSTRGSTRISPDPAKKTGHTNPFSCQPGNSQTPRNPVKPGLAWLVNLLKRVSGLLCLSPVLAAASPFLRTARRANEEGKRRRSAWCWPAGQSDKEKHGSGRLETKTLQTYIAFHFQQRSRLPLPQPIDIATPGFFGGALRVAGGENHLRRSATIVPSPLPSARPPLIATSARPPPRPPVPPPFSLSVTNSFAGGDHFLIVFSFPLLRPEPLHYL